MADLIAPFPDHISRTAFGYWLSGFVDGEGSFILRYYHISDGKHGVRYYQPSAQFAINLRSDDLPVLRLIQSYWQCGLLKTNKVVAPRSPNPRTCLNVYSCHYLATVLVPHFLEFPLHAKKHRDFLLWGEAVNICYSVNIRRCNPRPRNSGDFQGTNPKWTSAEVTRFLEIYNELQEIRKYDPSRAE